MQKKKDIPLRTSGPEVHHRRSACSCREHVIRELARNGDSSVRASSVNDNKLFTIGKMDVLQRITKVFCLVQNRDDYT